MITLDELRQKPYRVRRQVALSLTTGVVLVICAIGFTLPKFDKPKDESDNSPIKSISALFSDLKEHVGNPFASIGPVPDVSTSTSAQASQEAVSATTTQEAATSSQVFMATSTPQETPSLNGFPIPDASF
jgi:hypothetical protein